MFKPITRVSHHAEAAPQGRPRYEHWLVDNQVYFITARCRDRFHAFAGEGAKEVFWDRFDHYTQSYGFTPWVTSLMDNHYHTIGYLKVGKNLPPMMQRIHGSVAKLVNDLLPERRLNFWRNSKGQEYFDGCIRNPQQASRAYRYTETQAVRHGLVAAGQPYRHTHVEIDLQRAIQRSVELDAFLDGVPYKRYQGY